MAKLTGGILVMFSVLALSMHFYFKGQLRLRALRDVQKALTVFYGYVEFSVMPLPYIFKEVCDKSDGAGKEIFQNVCLLIREKEIDVLESMWCLSADKCSALEPKDKEVVKSIGSVLGKLDKQLQLNSITLALEGIKQNQRELTDKLNKNGTLYIRIGGMAAVLIIILLI